jgi:hypothetical protein
MCGGGIPDRRDGCPTRSRLQPRGRGASPGVALVVTLIMLAIITVITVTILAIVRRDRMSATQAQSLTDARLAMEAALNRALSEIVAQALTNQSLLGFDLTASRSLSNDVTQLLFDPRVPVFPANLMPSEMLEGRFFLDLNRNGMFEDTVVATNAAGVAIILTGDPQWIGLLEKPSRVHGGNNRFTSRYAFIVVPAGKTLDVNWIHNMASPDKGAWKYFRDQGFGPYEINLAGLLADLNTNVWWGPLGYQYYPANTPSPGLVPRTDGTAFQDASGFLNYRYGGNLSNLPSIFNLYSTNGLLAFREDGFDGYSAFPYAIGAGYFTQDTDDPNLPWSGADSVRHFFDLHDFYDTNKLGPDFVNRLWQTGTNTDDYNRYMFYRMLGSLGTDSAPGQGGKIHLNYANDASLGLSQTNFIPWDTVVLDQNNQPIDLSVRFFTTVAERLFREQFFDFNPGWTNDPATSVTNIPSMTHIPIAPTNYYSPAVHRLLQVAANIFDASRPSSYPSVFRPLFTVFTNAGFEQVFLTGFTNDNRRSTLPDWLAENRRYGVPFVIGAKKGFPNFNEFTMQTDIQVTRKLQLVRAPALGSATGFSPPFRTNQMYILGISNLFAVEAWNSYIAPYAPPYKRPLRMEVTVESQARITNPEGLDLVVPFAVNRSITNVFWPGRLSPVGNFIMPLNTNMLVLWPSVYRYWNGWLGAPTFAPVAYAGSFSPPGVPTPSYPLPNWHLTISNLLQYIVSDGDQIVDFVLSKEFNSAVDIDTVLFDDRSESGVSGVTENSTVTDLWNTNRVGGVDNDFAPTQGIVNQVAVSLGALSVNDSVWRSYLDDAARGLDKERAIRAFQAFCQVGAGAYANQALGMTNLLMQAPFCPTRKFIKTMSWQANDPLVHYHAGDLIFPGNARTNYIVPPTGQVPSNMYPATLWGLNRNYSPWGGNPAQQTDPFSSLGPDPFNLAIKDPGARSSDDWDFPTNKFASVGWLGRVHRGTPWQTIYFKIANPEADRATWTRVSSEYLWEPTKWFRAHPTNDWALADMFTVATDANSTRGLLSVNNANLAAWSALLDGLVVFTNSLRDQDLLAKTAANSPIPLTEVFVQPAGAYIYDPNDLANPPLVSLLDGLAPGINKYRLTLPNQTFTSLAQFLQVPALTLRSPWLNTKPDPTLPPLPGITNVQACLGLTDAAYERLPQQILSLVKVGDARFVIYAYGQALKPARDSIDTTRGNVCTSYQVTAEVAARVVFDLESPTYEVRTNGEVRLIGVRAALKNFNLLPAD